jgi:class 3 adenylate cyclase
MSSQGSAERKLVTVLVVDTVGSTALAESMDPEEWTGIMFEAHERMKRVIHRYGGTVAQFTGDGVLAFFGAPRTREDDAVRAVMAGLDLQQELGQYESELLAARRVPHLTMRIGLHTGTVVVGDVGNALYSDYVAVGETVPLAQRIQSAGVPRAVVLSNETARMVTHAFELHEAGRIETGAGQGMTLWQVAGTRARATRAEPTAFVGREQEMEQLKRAVDPLATGRGALVTIVGDAGVGKSRLAEELREYARARFDALNWFEARGVSFGGGIYALFQQILRAGLGIRESDSVEAIRARLRLGAERQKFRDPELVVHMLELMLSIDDKNGEDRFANLQGQALKQELFETVRNTKRALAIHRPTVFVLEEMHWADAESVELALFDAGLVRELPILILATCRPDRDAPSFNYREQCAANFADVYQEIELEPLAPADARELLNALTQNRALPAHLKEQLLDKTEGNPLFIEQLVQGLAEAGGVARAEGAGGETVVERGLTLPNSLHAVLTARLDRLSEPTRRVLGAASVIGRTFTLGQLGGALARMGWEDLAEAASLHLAVLERQQLVTGEADGGDARWGFKHALIQDAAYGSLLKKRRRELHRSVLETLLELYGARADEHAAELASHAQAGEAWDAAYQWARRAAENAERVFAPAEARREYRRAEGALDRRDMSAVEKETARAEIERALALI